VTAASSGCACRGGPGEPYRPPGGTLLYLSRDDLESLGIGMLEVVEAVRRGCAAKGRGEVVMPPKLSLHGTGDAYSQVMAATLPGDGGLGAKWVTLFPDNVARGLPITNGLVVLSNPETGLPAAVMDAGAITAWRTGASVGVAARYLARPEAACVGVLGCGVQARAAVRALAAVLPGLRAVRCHDAVEAAVDAFSAELGAERADLERRLAELLQQ
jgi:ornithine cyclodeaminase/alanine dehydrogenase